MTLPRTFCIKLKSSDARWHIQSKYLESLSIKAEPFEGFDGLASGLSTTQVYDKDVPGSNYKIGPKHIGMCLSHYMLWQALWVADVESAVVLEDDAMFDADWLDRFSQAMAALPNDWDMVYLGSCCAKGRPSTSVGNNLYEVKWPLCTHAYMVRRKAIPILLSDMQRIWASIDLALFFGPLTKLRVYTVLPRLAHQRDTVLEP